MGLERMVGDEKCIYVSRKIRTEGATGKLEAYVERY